MYRSPADRKAEAARYQQLTEQASLKGSKDGNCNREACQRPGATWYNKGTHKYYCQSCAWLINEYPTVDGTPLCSNTK